MLLHQELSWQGISPAMGQSPSPCSRAKASDRQMLTGHTTGSVRDVFEHGSAQGGRGTAPQLPLTAHCSCVCPHGSQLLGSAAQTGSNQVPAKAPQGWLDEGLHLDCPAWTPQDPQWLQNGTGGAVPLAVTLREHPSPKLGSTIPKAASL